MTLPSPQPIDDERGDQLADLIPGPELAIFLNFDGTLSHPQEDPLEAALSNRARSILLTLKDLFPVAIISGRDLDDLRMRVNIDGIAYAGEYGIEILDWAGNRWEHPQIRDLDEAIHHGTRMIQDLEQRHPGTILESKRHGATLHYKLVRSGKAREALIEEFSGAMLALPGLRAQNRHLAVELRPNIPWDKGDALLHLLGTLPGEETPIFAGGDFTDEDAFEVIHHHGIGIAVLAQKRGSWAKYSVEGVEELLTQLATIIKATK